MFGRKHEKSKQAIEQADADMRQQPSVITTKIDPVTGPIAALCADIMGHLKNYRHKGWGIENIEDNKIYLGRYSASGFSMTDAEQTFSRPTYDFFMGLHANDERKAEDEARADLAARLAKVKAERVVPQPKVGVASGKSPAPHKTAKPHCCQIHCNSDSTWRLQWHPYHYENTADACSVHLADMVEFAEATEFHIVPLENTRGGGGLVTIETATPGDDTPVYRDFLTEGTIPRPKVGVASRKDGNAAGPGTITITIRPGELFLWIDHEGRKHPTDQARLEANKAIEAKRRAQKAGAG